MNKYVRSTLIAYQLDTVTVIEIQLLYVFPCLSDGIEAISALDQFEIGIAVFAEDMLLNAFHHAFCCDSRGSFGVANRYSCTADFASPSGLSHT